MPAWFAVAICCLALVNGFNFWAQYRFHSYRFAIAYLQGVRLQLRPTTNLIGTHAPGESFRTGFRITNHGSKPVTILGGMADCSCVARDGLPRKLEAGETATLSVSIRFGDDLGDWRKTIRYLTDDPRQPTLQVELTGVVASAPQSGIPGDRR